MLLSPRVFGLRSLHFEGFGAAAPAALPQKNAQTVLRSALPIKPSVAKTSPRNRSEPFAASSGYDISRLSSSARLRMQRCVR